MSNVGNTAVANDAESDYESVDLSDVEGEDLAANTTDRDNGVEEVDEEDGLPTSPVKTPSNRTAAHSADMEPDGAVLTQLAPLEETTPQRSVKSPNKGPSLAERMAILRSKRKGRCQKLSQNLKRCSSTPSSKSPSSLIESPATRQNAGRQSVDVDASDHSSPQAQRNSQTVKSRRKPGAHRQARKSKFQARQSLPGSSDDGSEDDIVMPSHTASVLTKGVGQLSEDIGGPSAQPVSKSSRSSRGSDEAPKERGPVQRKGDSDSLNKTVVRAKATLVQNVPSDVANPTVTAVVAVPVDMKVAKRPAGRKSRNRSESGQVTSASLNGRSKAATDETNTSPAMSTGTPRRPKNVPLRRNKRASFASASEYGDGEATENESASGEDEVAEQIQEENIEQGESSHSSDGRDANRVEQGAVGSAPEGESFPFSTSSGPVKFNGSSSKEQASNVEENFSVGSVEKPSSTRAPPVKKRGSKASRLKTGIGLKKAAANPSPASSARVNRNTNPMSARDDSTSMSPHKGSSIGAAPSGSKVSPSSPSHSIDHDSFGALPNNIPLEPTHVESPSSKSPNDYGIMGTPNELEEENVDLQTPMHLDTSSNGFEADVTGFRENADASGSESKLNLRERTSSVRGQRASKSHSRTERIVTAPKRRATRVQRKLHGESGSRPSENQDKEATHGNIISKKHTVAQRAKPGASSARRSARDDGTVPEDNLARQDVLSRGGSGLGSADAGDSPKAQNIPDQKPELSPHPFRVYPTLLRRRPPSYDPEIDDSTGRVDSDLHDQIVRDEPTARSNDPALNHVSPTVTVAQEGKEKGVTSAHDRQLRLARKGRSNVDRTLANRNDKTGSENMASGGDPTLASKKRRNIRGSKVTAKVSNATSHNEVTSEDAQQTALVSTQISQVPEFAMSVADNGDDVVTEDESDVEENAANRTDDLHNPDIDEGETSKQGQQVDVVEVAVDSDQMNDDNGKDIQERDSTRHAPKPFNENSSTMRNHTAQDGNSSTLSSAKRSKRNQPDVDVGGHGSRGDMEADTVTADLNRLWFYPGRTEKKAKPIRKFISVFEPREQEVLSGDDLPLPTASTLEPDHGMDDAFAIESSGGQQPASNKEKDSARQGILSIGHRDDDPGIEALDTTQSGHAGPMDSVEYAPASKGHEAHLSKEPGPESWSRDNYHGTFENDGHENVEIGIDPVAQEAEKSEAAMGEVTINKTNPDVNPNSSAISRADSATHRADQSHDKHIRKRGVSPSREPQNNNLGHPDDHNFEESIPPDANDQNPPGTPGPTEEVVSSRLKKRSRDEDNMPDVQNEEIKKARVPNSNGPKKLKVPRNGPTTRAKSCGPSVALTEKNVIVIDDDELARTRASGRASPTKTPGNADAQTGSNGVLENGERDAADTDETSMPPRHESLRGRVPWHKDSVELGISSFNQMEQDLKTFLCRQDDEVLKLMRGLQAGAGHDGGESGIIGEPCQSLKISRLEARVLAMKEVVQLRVWETFKEFASGVSRAIAEEAAPPISLADAFAQAQPRSMVGHGQIRPFKSHSHEHILNHGPSRLSNAPNPHVFGNTSHVTANPVTPCAEAVFDRDVNNELLVADVDEMGADDDQDDDLPIVAKANSSVQGPSKAGTAAGTETRTETEVGKDKARHDRLPSQLPKTASRGKVAQKTTSNVELDDDTFYEKYGIRPMGSIRKLKEFVGESFGRLKLDCYRSEGVLCLCAMPQGCTKDVLHRATPIGKKKIDSLVKSLVESGLLNEEHEDGSVVYKTPENVIRLR